FFSSRRRHTRLVSDWSSDVCSSDLQRGKHEVAIDLSSDQALTIKGNKRLNVRTGPSTWVFFLLMNNDPSVSSVTSNKQFQTAVRSEERRVGKECRSRWWTEH